MPTDKHMDPNDIRKMKMKNESTVADEISDNEGRLLWKQNVKKNNAMQNKINKEQRM